MKSVTFDGRRVEKQERGDEMPLSRPALARVDLGRFWKGGESRAVGAPQLDGSSRAPLGTGA